jgi:hypothetical protein
MFFLVFFSAIPFFPFLLPFWNFSSSTEYYKNLTWLLHNHIEDLDLDLTFTVDENVRRRGWEREGSERGKLGGEGSQSGSGNRRWKKAGKRDNHFL